MIDKLMRLVTFLLILVLLSSCAGSVKTSYEKDKALVHKVSHVKESFSKPPLWVIGKGHPSFPTSRFLIGVGISEKNSVSANQSARSELAKSLQVKIRSVMRDISTQKTTRLYQVIETQVDTILEGVDVKDGWYDPNKKFFYSLAVLDRNLVGTSVLNQIDEIEARLPELMRVES